MLKKLWESSEAFYTRFNSYPPDTNGMLRVFNEETYEFIEAALTRGEREMAEEAADVIVTIMGTLMSRGVTIEALEDAMAQVAAKNDAKTHETHYVNSNNKIARRD